MDTATIKNISIYAINHGWYLSSGVLKKIIIVEKNR